MFFLYFFFGEEWGFWNTSNIIYIYIYIVYPFILQKYQKNGEFNSFYPQYRVLRLLSTGFSFPPSFPFTFHLEVD